MIRDYYSFDIPIQDDYNSCNINDILSADIHLLNYPIFDATLDNSTTLMLYKLQREQFLMDDFL